MLILGASKFTLLHSNHFQEEGGDFAENCHVDSFGGKKRGSLKY